MVLKTGKKCTWNEIEVGEVFAVNGCWMIGIKNCLSSWSLLGSDFDDIMMLWYPDSFSYYVVVECGDSFYKLPKSVQKLWKEE